MSREGIRDRLPELTHLQFLVLSLLGPREKAGRQVRDALARHGVTKTGPAFYQLMARMEDSGLLSGRYNLRSVDGQLIKERVYRITAGGIGAANATRKFYGSLSGARTNPRLVDA